jgi:hypothetical protein
MIGQLFSVFGRCVAVVFGISAAYVSGAIRFGWM